MGLVAVLLGGGCAGANVSLQNTELDLSNSGLETVPSYVFEEEDITTLDLSNNQITGALPGEIRFLRQLRVLDVSNNRMTGVPAEIGQLSALEYLDLSNNDLTGLPLELGALLNLRELDLRGNAIAQFDLEIIRSQLEDVTILE